MKVYISADIEGVAGITHWDEAAKSKPEYYNEFRELMTKEVLAACEGAFEAGASEIWIKDAHGTGRNIIGEMLPSRVRLLRGWSGHPYRMVQEIDQSFDALMFVGYHSRAGSGGNPLAHTLRGMASEIIINGRQASEFFLHTMVAATEKVPCVFLSGDQELCGEVKEFDERIVTAPVSVGIGPSTVSLSPYDARKLIKEGVHRALSHKSFEELLHNVDNNFDVKLKYKDQNLAYKASFYPGASLVDPYTISFESKDFIDVMRMFLFVLSVSA